MSDLPPAPKYLSGPRFAALTEQERRFVELYVDHGLPRQTAYREAGYASKNSATSKEYMERPAIAGAIAERAALHQDLFKVTRKEVIDGLKEAVDMSRTMSEPAVMVMAWREVARLCGYYEPVKHKIDVTVSGQVTVKQIQEMSDQELLKLTMQTEAVEGSFTRVADGTESSES